MGESVAAIVVAGVVQVTGMVIGFLTLWVKLKHAGENAQEAVVRANIVEEKLDANTATTKSVDTKADTIVSQTNGTLERTQRIIEDIAARVTKLEEYNRTASHRVLDAINAMHIRVVELAARIPKLIAQEQSKAVEP